MTKPWPLSSIKPLKRLQVEDEVLINAERWQVAHNYHHQRQNIHYQSVNQAGIVCGLGVRIIELIDEEISDPIYEDGRGIQIQPGIAIDMEGNIIVVPKAENFHIDTEVKTQESQMVFVVVSYPDPEELNKSRNNGKEYNPIVQETFRILEKTDKEPVSDKELEVCRIKLQKSQDGKVKLEKPNEVFNPGYNQLDLRYRVQACAKPQAIVRFATIKKQDSPNALTFSNLRSLPSLYPALQVTACQEKDFATISNYDLLFLKEQHLAETNLPEEDLKEYLNKGGVILIEIPLTTTATKNIITQQKLEKALSKINDLESGHQDSKLAPLTEIKPNLEADLQTIEKNFDEEINQKLRQFDLLLELEIPIENWENLQPNHPLRTEPFLFGALPSITGSPIQILTQGGIVMIIGSLFSIWELDSELTLPRETIRTAQEMTINILHFAWRRRQMTKLLGKVTSNK